MLQGASPNLSEWSDKPTGEAVLAATNGSNAALVEAIKETHRHMEELYRQAGEGRLVSDGLNAARERASALTDALIKAQHLNEKLSDASEAFAPALGSSVRSTTYKESEEK